MYCWLVLDLRKCFVGVRVKPRNCIRHFFQEAKTIIYFDLKSDAEQFVKERQEIKSLQTCESHFFLTFPTEICDVSVIRFALQKIVKVDTRFYPDTDGLLFGVNGGYAELLQ